MAKMKIYDTFPNKKEAQKTAKNLRKQGVQYVRIRKVNQDSGRLKYAIYLGGKNSSMYV